MTRKIVFSGDRSCLFKLTLPCIQYKNYDIINGYKFVIYPLYLYLYPLHLPSLLLQRGPEKIKPMFPASRYPFHWNDSRQSLLLSNPLHIPELLGP